MADLWRDFWIRETGTGQQVAQFHDRYDDDDDDDDDGRGDILMGFLFMHHYGWYSSADTYSTTRSVNKFNVC